MARSSRLQVVEDNSDLRLGTWVQFARTFHVLQRRVTQLLSANDVTLAQFDVLATLRFSEGATQQELAERLLVTKGNVCGLLDRLEEAGWVQRKADSGDGRTNRLHLTARGKRKIEAVLPQHDTLILGIFARLNEKETQTLRTLLTTLESEA